MQDPPCSSRLSKRAYDDFLMGLDLINQQEYIYETFAKNTPISKAESETMFNGIHPTPEPNFDTWYDRAIWERQVAVPIRAFA